MTVRGYGFNRQYEFYRIESWEDLYNLAHGREQSLGYQYYHYYSINCSASLDGRHIHFRLVSNLNSVIIKGIPISSGRSKHLHHHSLKL